VHLHPRQWSKSRGSDIVKVIWASLAAPIVCGVWLAFFTIEEVYGGNVNMIVMGVVGLLVDVIAAVILVVFVSHQEPHYDMLVNDTS